MISLLNAWIRMDKFIGRHMIWFILSMLTIGVVFSDTLSPLSAYSSKLMMIITFCNSLGGGFRDMGRVMLHPRPALVVMGLLHVVMPVFALLIGKVLLPNDPLFMTGLVLEYTIPTAISSLIWIGMYSGNIQLCLSLVLLDTLLAPFVIPAVLQVLLGSVVELDALGMMRDLLIMIALPAMAAMSIYQLSGGRVTKTVKPCLSPIGKFALFTIVIANATSCAPFLKHMTPTLFLVVVLICCMGLIGFLLGFTAGKLLGMDFPTVCTMTINTGMRNNSVGAVLAGAYFPPDVLFPVALAPLFSQLTASVAVRVLQKTRLFREYHA